MKQRIPRVRHFKWCATPAIRTVTVHWSLFHTAPKAQLPSIKALLHKDFKYLAQPLLIPD
ncbi:MAG: hypothetical protein AB1418_02475 [Pseudomonadota bacterium]